MSKEPLHPIVRLLFGKVASEHIEPLEFVLGPLRGRRALWTMSAFVLPTVVISFILGFFELWEYAWLGVTLPLLFFVCRGIVRQLKD